MNSAKQRIWIGDMEDESNAASQTQMLGWQDIRTAPIGKSVIICTWWKHSPSSAFRAEGYLDSDTKTWRNQDGSPISEDRTQPTHWQPIPDAPTASSQSTNFVGSNGSVEQLAKTIANKVCELDETSDPVSDDAILISAFDMEVRIYNTLLCAVTGLMPFAKVVEGSKFAELLRVNEDTVLYRAALSTQTKMRGKEE